MSYKQHAPFTIKVEMTEGCNLRCTFCGVLGIREKAGDYKFLEVSTAKKIAKQIAQAKWNSKLEFTMHGEPLMNPNATEIVQTFRKYLPDNQIMVSTNSAPLLKPPGIRERVKALFDAGMNILVVDCYDVVEKVWSKIPDLCGDLAILTKYPKEGQSPNRRYPKKQRRIIMIEDLAHANTQEHTKDGRPRLGTSNRSINNHCGAGGPEIREPLEKRCARPFRELTTRWNGAIAICCNDWRGDFKCGTVHDSTLLEIWHGPAFTAVRKALYHADRNFKPCDICDDTSWRPGLLPDPVGKETLPKPKQRDWDAIERATKGKSYTLPVLRPWET